MAIVKTSYLELDFNKGIKTNVEIVDGKLELTLIQEFAIHQNIVPNMTSNNVPSPFIISASSVYQNLPQFQPYRAFTRDILDASAWVSAQNVNSAWIQVDINLNNFNVTKYSITSRYVDNRKDPKTWKFQASNNNSAWVDLHSVNNEDPWDKGEKRYYSFTNEQTFRYYRLSFSEAYTVGTGDAFAIGQIEIINEYTEKIFSPSGTIEFPTTDLGTHFREIKSVSSIKNIPENTNIKIFTSTSNDNITYSDYSLVDNGTGLITSPQGRYIKVKAELIGNSEEATRVLNDFDESESSQFITDEQIVFDGSLHLKNEYIDQMVEDTTWSDEGKLFRKSLNKPQFKQIDNVEVK